MNTTQRIYHRRDGGTETVAEVLAEAQRIDTKLPLIVHVHRWNRWACSGLGGRSVSVRAAGQYTDYARATLATSTDAEQFAAELRAALAAADGAK